MSQENVEIFRRLHEALGARRVPEELIAPDFFIENVVTAVSDKTYIGADGVGAWISDTFDGLAEGARFEVEKVITDGDDFVVGRVAIVGQGVRSGAPLYLRWINVCWFHDGKATRGAGYGNRAEALKAAGLEE